jgi:hypothetical protein
MLIHHRSFKILISILIFIFSFMTNLRFFDKRRDFLDLFLKFINSSNDRISPVTNS